MFKSRLKKMRFDVNEELTPNEKGNLVIFMSVIGRRDLLKKVVEGELTRNEVKELIDPLKNVIANCENDTDPNSSAQLIGPVSKSILEKFENFLG